MPIAQVERRRAGRHTAGAAGRVAGSSRARHRDDIQGLRAVAVLAVVLYHAGVPWLGGGYVGVDVFFVISGFLITGMLTREVARTDRISFAGFYARRARRILPAAALVLLVTVLAAVFLLTPLRAQSVLRDAQACAVFAGNYRFAAVGTNYLAGETAPSPLQHYWSLGVEEQFYLLWPAIVLAAALLARRWRPALPTVLGVLTVASFVLGWRWTAQNPPWAFFSLPSRAWELGVGGLVSLLLPRLSTRLAARRLLACLGWAGLGIVMASVVLLDSSAHFPGVIALLPVAGAALALIGAAQRHGAGAILARRPLVLVGDLSYGWYLWHWPLLILAPVAVGHPLALGWRLAAAGGSLVLAGLSLVLVENPVRFARPVRVPRRALAMAAALVVVSAAVPVAAGTVVADPARGHRAAAQATLAGAPSVTAPDPSGTTSSSVPPETATLRDIQAAVQSSLRAAVQTTEVPSNLQPPLDGAYDDSALPFQDGCDLSYTDVTQGPCTYTTGSKTVVLFGDSHAAQWFPAVQQLAAGEDWSVQSFSKTLCPPVRLPELSPYLGRAYTECDQWREQMFSRIEAEHPALVILGASRRYGRDFGFTMYGPQWDAALAAAVAELRAAGSRVLVLGPVPDPHGSVPDCLSDHPEDVTQCTVPRAVGVDAAGEAGERAAVERAGGDYVDVAPWVCTDTTCAVIVGPILVYRDDNHLTTTYVRWLTPLVQATIDAVFAGAPLPT